MHLYSSRKHDNIYFEVLFSLVFMFLITFLFLYTPYKYFKNIANSKIQSYKQSNSSFTY